MHCRPVRDRALIILDGSALAPAVDKSEGEEILMEPCVTVIIIVNAKLLYLIVFVYVAVSKAKFA